MNKGDLYSKLIKVNKWLSLRLSIDYNGIWRLAGYIKDDKATQPTLIDLREWLWEYTKNAKTPHTE